MTLKQKIFCEKYLQNGFNATKAAIAAGYSKKTAEKIGSQNTSKLELKEYLNKRIKSLLSDTDKITLEWVQSVLKIARADIRKAAKWNGKNFKLISSEEVDNDTAYAINEVSETIGVQHERRSIKFESKTKALELLGKYLAILSDNESPAADKEERISREERKRRISSLVKKT
jgi:phage terminase small subunit